MKTAYSRQCIWKSYCRALRILTRITRIKTAPKRMTQILNDDIRPSCLALVLILVLRQVCELANVYSAYSAYNDHSTSEPLNLH